MKNLLIVISFVLFSGSVSAQTIPSYASIVGTRFESGTMNPVLVSPNDGQMVDLRSNPASSDSFISGNSTVDAQGNTYFYTRGNGAQLIKVNIATGAVNSVNITNPNQAIHPIVSPQYNPADSLIYGLNFIQGQLRLASLDPTTGVTTIINPNFWIGDQFLAGDATLDTANGVFYFLRGSTATQLVAMDIQTGAIQTTQVNGPSNSLQNICNIQWNHSNNTLYGLNFKNGFLTIASLNPATGNVTLLSSNYTSGDGFQNGVSALDESNKTYYYVAQNGGHTVGRLFSVDITSGQLLGSTGLSSSTSLGTLTNIEIAPNRIAHARFTSEGDCGNTEVKFYNASQGLGYLWDFGDGNTSNIRNPIYSYSQPGTYTVKLYSSALNTSLATETITVNTPFTFDLGPDTALSFGDSIVLRAPQGGTAMWSTGVTADSIVVTQGGTYWGAAHLNGCTQRDSITVQLQGAFSIDISQGQVTATDADTITSTITVTNLTLSPYHFDCFISLNHPTGWHWTPSVTGNADEAGIYDFNIHAGGTAHMNLHFITHQAGTANAVVTLRNQATGFQETYLLKATLDEALSVVDFTASPLNAFPNPARRGDVVTFSNSGIAAYRLYSIEGKLVEQGRSEQFTAPIQPGIYLLHTHNRITKVVVE